jgi:hypothetical protein
LRRRGVAASALALAFALVALSAARRADAQTAPQAEAPKAPDCGVVQFVTDANDSFAERVRVELIAMGYQLDAALEFEPGKPLGPCVRAVVRVEASKRRAELWTSAQGRAQFRASVFADAAGSSDEETLAVCVAEDLRAYVTPLPASRPRRPEPAAARGGRRADEAGERRLKLGADLGLGASPGGPSVGAFLMVRGRWMLHSQIGIGALAGLPLTASKVERAAGEATIRPFLVGAEGYWRLTPPAARFDAGLGAGVLLASLAMSGTASAPFTSTTDHVVTALPFVSAEASPRLFDRVRLRAGALAGAATPQAGVRFAGERVSEWGRPFVLLSAGASVEF